MQKFVDGQKMGMGQVTATFPKQSFKCWSKEDGCDAKHKLLFQHLERVTSFWA
jgi:hypothetical protein